jgi:hypothetical protein
MSKITEFFNLIHVNSLLRFPSYAIGLVLGYYLNNRSQIDENALKIGKIVASAFFWSTIVWTLFISTGNLENALYTALAPILLCFPIAWFIFTSHLDGHKSKY